jgi:phosphotransferase system HPr-like phosphotransfer protein
VSQVTKTADGFTFQITNYDSDAGRTVYTIATSLGSILGQGDTITVSDLTPGQQAAVTLTTLVGGYAAVVTSVTDGALALGTLPGLSAPVSAARGFTFEITNYSSLVEYTLSATEGTVRRSGSIVTVSGLAASENSTVRVSAARAGYTSVAATLTGVAEEAAVIVPTPVTETPVNPTPVVNPPLAAAAPSPAQFLAAPGAVPSTVRVAPVVGTGAGAVTVNGVPVPFEISQSGNTRTFASSDGSSVSITPGSGAGSGELIAGAMLQILFGGEMKVGVAGFLPGSTVDVSGNIRCRRRVGYVRASG